MKYHIANIAGKLGVAATADLRRWPGAPAASARRPTEIDMRHDSPLRLGPVAQVSLYVRDVRRAERFYGETLGLPHHFTFGDLAFFDMAGTRLYLHAVPEEKWRPG